MIEVFVDTSYLLALEIWKQQLGLQLGDTIEEKTAHEYRAG